jgi:uncharacterized protein
MRHILVFSIIAMFLLNACGQGNGNVDNKKWVFDYEEVIDDNQEYLLDSIIREFEEQTTNEIVIVTVNNIGEFDKMVEYAVDFGEKHGVGKKEKDNGLVILFSKSMRETFLATGYGTEKILKDEICKAIIDSTMIPYFKNQDYFGGLKSGLEECIIRWK